MHIEGAGKSEKTLKEKDQVLVKTSSEGFGTSDLLYMNKEIWE